MDSTPPTPLRVLVLDAQYTHALAAVRSLGRKRAVVTAASHKPMAQGFASKYCARRLQCPDPNRERPAYVQWLLETVRHQRYDAVLTFEEATADVLSDYLATVHHYAGCAMPGRDSFLTAAHKDRATHLAQSLGLHVPRTFRLQAVEDLAQVVRELEFPLVVKGVASSGGQQVAIATNAADLGHEVRRIAALRRDPTLALPVVQEYIPGQGYGVTALMRQGTKVAAFAHRRLAEHDIRRGVQYAHGATGAESVYEPQLIDDGLRLLAALGWHGIAMVEFRRHTHNGNFYFVEINPRFVGSLELAIAAGVDFPWLYAQVAAQRPVAGPTRYRAGLKYRWLISKNVAGAFEKPWQYLWGLASSLRFDARTDVSFRDPRPHLCQLRSAAWWVREHVVPSARPTPADPEPRTPAPSTQPPSVPSRS